LAKQLATALLDLVDQKGQHHQDGQDGGEMLLPMSIVMFEMIALVLERIEGFILNLPAAAPSMSMISQFSRVPIV